jgi:hypothetical protein
MRRFLVCLGLCGLLGAQAPLHIVTVEHTGPPPYESEDRVYGLDGGQDQGLRVGDRLLVKRTGDVRAIGHLWVTEVRGHRAGARYEPMEETYPMKGDLAILEVLKGLPEAVRLNADPLPVASPPGSTAKAPPREGVLFFLPKQAELSPAGVKKVEAWVQGWGREGQWGIQVPTAKASKPVLQKQRVASLEAILHTLGLEHVKVETDPRTTEGKNDPVWIRHWD